MQPAFTFPAQQYFQVFHVTSKSYSKVLRVPSHGLQISLICRLWLRILKKNEDEVLGLKVWTICGMWPITTFGITELSKTLGHDNRMKESNWWPLVLCIGWVYKLGLKIIFGRWPDMITEQRNFCLVKSLFQNGQNTRETMGKNEHDGIFTKRQNLRFTGEFLVVSVWLVDMTGEWNFWPGKTPFWPTLSIVFWALFKTKATSELD